MESFDPAWLHEQCRALADRLPADDSLVTNLIVQLLGEGHVRPPGKAKRG